MVFRFLNMNLHRRFIISFGIIFLIVFTIFEGLMYQRIYRYEIENLKSKAEIVRGILMATRRIYHHQFINSGIPITEKTLGFLPAHALNKISHDFTNWYGSELSFNNVSDKPRNPNQKADDIEVGAMQFFRSNPTETVRFIQYNSSTGIPYYHYARPIWIEKYCLKCHGKKQNAPEAIQKLYDTAYDYNEGELRGILSIKISAKHLHERIVSEFITDMTMHFITFLLIFIAATVLLKRFVTQPITTITDGFNAILQGDYNTAMPKVTQDFVSMVTMADRFKSTNQLLVGREKHIKNLINSTAEGIYGLDLNGKCTFVNAACLKMTGFNHEEEFLNQHVHNMIHHTKTDGSNHPESECMACLSFREDRQIHVTDEIMWRKDGSHFPIEYRSFPVYEDDEIKGCVITFLDITEQKQLEHMQHQQERQAQTIHACRLTTLGEMATGIAHEMNQPLAGISYTTTFLQKAFELKKLDDEDFCDSLKDIDSCIKRMSRIINHIRTFARQDDPNMGVNKLKPTLSHIHNILILHLIKAFFYSWTGALMFALPLFYTCYM